MFLSPSPTLDSAENGTIPDCLPPDSRIRERFVPAFAESRGGERNQRKTRNARRFSASDRNYSAGAALRTDAVDTFAAMDGPVCISLRWRRWRSQIRMPVTPSNAGISPVMKTISRQAGPV